MLEVILREAVVKVNRAEPGFDKACESERFMALDLFGIDEDGHSAELPAWERSCCSIRSKFEKYSSSGHSSHTYSFTVSAVKVLTEDELADREPVTIIGSNAIDLIKEERLHQLQIGYTAEKDDRRDRHELALEAVNWLLTSTNLEGRSSARGICGSLEDRRAKTRIEQLSVAGALVAAELDRELRLLANTSINLFTQEDNS